MSKKSSNDNKGYEFTHEFVNKYGTKVPVKFKAGKGGHLIDDLKTHLPPELYEKHINSGPLRETLKKHLAFELPYGSHLDTFLVSNRVYAVLSERHEELKKINDQGKKISVSKLLRDPEILEAAGSPYKESKDKKALRNIIEAYFDHTSFPGENGERYKLIRRTAPKKKSKTK